MRSQVFSQFGDVVRRGKGSCPIMMHQAIKRGQSVADRRGSDLRYLRYLDLRCYRGGLNKAEPAISSRLEDVMLVR
jgi:hypothetical protein